jgi:hypothetical protein
MIAGLLAVIARLPAIIARLPALIAGLPAVVAGRPPETHAQGIPPAALALIVAGETVHA